MSPRKCLLLSFVLGLLLFMSRVTAGGTNGERMARGLHPAPPKFNRILPGISPNDITNTPSRVLAAKRSKPSSSPLPPTSSPLPPTMYYGKIEVRAKDGSKIGNVRNWEHGSVGGINFEEPDQDILVSCTVRSRTEPFDIYTDNAIFSEPFYIGAVGGNTIGPGSRNIAGLSNVGQTPPYSGPMKFESRGTFEQSAIWTIKKGTKEIRARYINSDGSKPTTTIAYDIRSNVLFFTGDLAKYNRNNTTPASEVKLFITPPDF